MRRRVRLCGALLIAATALLSAGGTEINGFDQSKAWLTVKTSRVMPPGTGTMHFILAVTDHGTPRLTRYQRVIVDVQRRGPVNSSGQNSKRYPGSI